MDEDSESAIYLPDDLRSIRALQARIDALKVPDDYTDAEKKKIMSGRSTQRDIDAGRQTIEQRATNIKNIQTQIGTLSEQLRQLKNDSSGRFAGFKSGKNQEAQATYDASPFGMTMNAVKSYGPYAGGAGLGYLYGSGINTLANGQIDRQAANLRSAADAANKLDWNNPAVRDQLRGTVATGEKYLPPNWKGALARNAITKSIAFGVPAAYSLYESDRYNDRANNPSLSPGERQNFGMLSNALLAGSGELGFHGALGLAFPHTAETGADEATIRGARGALDRADRGGGGNVPPNGPAPGPQFGVGEPHGKVINDMGAHFGIQPGTKGDTYPLVGRAVDNADEPTLRAFAARVPSIGPQAAQTDSVATLRQAVRGVVDRVGTTAKKFAGSLGPIAVLGGIGAAALSPDEAEASVTGRLPQETNSLNPVPSRGEQVMNALSRTASAVPRAAAETAPYLVPGISQAMTARDMANTGDALYTPSRQYLDEAAHMQPGRIGREVDRAGLASNFQAAQAENARQVAEMRARQAAAGPRQFPQNQPIDPGSVPDSLRRFVDPSSALPQQNALAPQGNAPQQPNALNPQQQTQAPSPIQRPQSIPAEPQEAEAPPRPTPNIRADEVPGPLRRKQDKLIENALRQKEQERMMQNELALQGPDGNFYRALQAFQQHFAGAGAAAVGAR